MPLYHHLPSPFLSWFPRGRSPWRGRSQGSRRASISWPQGFPVWKSAIHGILLKISMCIISFPVGHLAGEICLLCHAMPEFLDVRVNFFSSSLRPLMAMWTELATATCSSRSFLREIQIKLAYNSYKVRPQMLLAKITHWTVSSSP